MFPSRLSVCVVALLAISAAASGQEPEAKKAPPAKVDRAGDPLPDGALARLGTMRFRHPGNVQFIGYAGDGNTLITSSGEATVHFWDARSGRELQRLQMTLPARGRRYPFRLGPEILLSGDGKTLVVGPDMGECSVVDVATRKISRR